MAKTEFERIINDEGYIVLMWNSRDRSSAFGQAYEQFLMDYAVDYKEVDHSRIGDEQFDYLMSTWKKFQFDNSQTLDLQGFLGRFTSSSYAPAPGTAAHSTASEALSAVFETFSHSTADGPRIELHYTTEVIIGKI
ncbi:MAG: hypothetical protein ACXAE3_15550 [Candidatus Kariarchaeaceae archaeon]|jgi:hypothetical protein